MSWLPFPMLRITAFFIAGIVTSIRQPALIPERVLTFSLLFFVLFYFLIVVLQHRNRWVKYFAAWWGMMFMFITGMLIADLKNESLSKDHLSHVNGNIDCFEAELISDPEPTANGSKSIAKVTSAKFNGHWRKVVGRIKMYWSKGDSLKGIQFGSRILVNGYPRPIESPKNPDEFDLKEYLGYKNIFHQCNIRQGAWRSLVHEPDRSLASVATQARRWSVSKIELYVASSREQAIVSALVLGVTDGLDTDLRQAYAANGAMHVLAVSGLHVAILYGVLLFFMKPLQKIPAGEWIIALCGLILLWSYALLTGLSPSVLRAVVMFSMFAVAKPIQRQTNIYNTLAASAFILLLYDPFIIMSVGFQLSYLAVWGIVALQRPIYQWFLLNHSILDWIWKVSSISIAAQLSTFALSIFYFHQFPTYFLVSNLFVIPGSFVILLGGLLMLLLSFWQLAASWCGLVLQWIVWIMNEGLFWIAEWPGSLIQPIFISPTQCWILYFILLTSMALIVRRRIAYAYGLLILAMSFSLARKDEAESRFVVFRVPGQRAMAWFDQGRGTVRLDSINQGTLSSFRFHAQTHIDRHIRSAESAATEWRGKNINIMVWKGKRFIHIFKPPGQLPSNLKADFLIISHDALDNVGMVNFDQVILDSSNTFRYSDRIRKESKALGKACTSVNLTGAYTYKIHHGIG